MREQSERCGTRIFTETVERVDLSKRPFKVWTDEKEVTAQTVIIATGAVAKRLPFKNSGEEEGGFWNKGISACAVCDGAAPIFRNKVRESDSSRVFGHSTRRAVAPDARVPTRLTCSTHTPSSARTRATRRPGSPSPSSAAATARWRRQPS